MKIEVIEFIRPYGQQEHREVDIDDKCQPNYSKLTKLGFRLTAERINNLVSICVEHPDYGDLQCNMYPNDLTIVRSIEKEILKFDEKSANEYIEQSI
jgi:hypothetical protein